MLSLCFTWCSGGSVRLRLRGAKEGCLYLPTASFSRLLVSSDQKRALTAILPNVFVAKWFCALGILCYNAFVIAVLTPFNAVPPAHAEPEAPAVAWIELMQTMPSPGSAPVAPQTQNLSQVHVQLSKKPARYLKNNFFHLKLWWGRCLPGSFWPVPS